VVIVFIGGNNFSTENKKTGYTLFIVLVILSITLILFSTTLLKIRATITNVKREVNQIQARYMAISGIVKVSGIINRYNNLDNLEAAEQVENFDENCTISVLLSQCGFFKRVISTGSCLREKYTISDLFGRTIPEEILPALTITGQLGGMILEQGSRIDGTVVMHHGYIYAKKRGDPLTEYTDRLIFRDSPSLPFDSIQFRNVFKRMENDFSEKINNSKKVSGPLVINSKTDTLLSRCPLVIDGDCILAADGIENAKLYISGNCVISSSASLHYCSVTAEKVTVDGGSTDRSLFFARHGITLRSGKHNSQFMSTDSIVAGTDSRCGPMTLLAGIRSVCTIDSQSVIDGGIYTEKNVNYQGSIICAFDEMGNNTRTQSTPSVVLGEGTHVKGVIVTDGECVLNRNTIEGHLWTRSATTSDSSGKYSNYLIGSVITESPTTLIFPLLGSAPVHVITSNINY
jgi:hypothetical protein